MTADITFAIHDFCAWSSSHEQAAMLGRLADAAVALPMLMRRRLTPSGQLLMKAALACAGVRQDVRYVLATRDGELTRTLRILSDVVESGLPSPADFSVSVHHALLGLLSIHTKNQAGHTAVSGGADSFGYGLLEAAACLSERSDQPVLLLYCDAPLPGSYASFEDVDAPRRSLLFALLLGRPAAGDTLSLRFSPVRPGIARVPCLAQNFLDFLDSGNRQQEAVGTDMTWEWSRAA